MPSDSFSRPASLPLPFDPLDRAPAPDAVEKDSDTAWDLFNSLADGRPEPIPDGDPRYAPTVAAGLMANPSPQERKPTGTDVTVDDVMVEARRNNRLCPQPQVWKHLYEMLPGKTRDASGWNPAPPIGSSAFALTPSLAKRMFLRDHIEWAGKHGGLDAVYAFLKDLPETDWHHVGD